ncbi:5-methylcytosine-specific restriction endonuclease McrA [Pseudomonas silensiensis]|nr:5-methylcytosine-specific restriction endonuclease McrA [Pseudomonas silensiensis]
MRIENGYLLSAWQFDNEIPPNKIYPVLIKQRGSHEKTFVVSLSGKSYRGSYVGVEQDDFIARVLAGSFPERATVRMRALNAANSVSNGWLIRNLELDSNFEVDEDAFSPSNTFPQDEINSRFEALMREAALLSPAVLEQKSAEFPIQPQKVWVTSPAFQRNPYVIIRALQRAKGFCECCGSAAPFFRKSDGTPYLEVHHKTPLAQGGDDTFENTVALCPNCHRQMHFG